MFIYSIVRHVLHQSLLRLTHNLIIHHIIISQFPHLLIIQQLCMHVAYAFCPAFFAAARRRWLLSCQLLRPEPPLD